MTITLANKSEDASELMTDDNMRIVITKQGNEAAAVSKPSAHLAVAIPRPISQFEQLSLHGEISS